MVLPKSAYVIIVSVFFIATLAKSACVPKQEDFSSSSVDQEAVEQSEIVANSNNIDLEGQLSSELEYSEESAQAPVPSNKPSNFRERPLSNDVTVLSVAVLRRIQEVSIREDVEYCGYIVKDLNTNELVAIEPERGNKQFCVTPIVDLNTFKLQAAYHTQGAYREDALTEIPSSRDFESASVDQVDSFISTPGGRVWRIDYLNNTAAIICDNGECVDRDQNYKRPELYSIPSTITMQTVSEIEVRLGFRAR